jgi:hypothetical protein
MYKPKRRSDLDSACLADELRTFILDGALSDGQAWPLVVTVTSGATGIDNDVSGGRVVVMPRDVDDDVSVDIDNPMDKGNCLNDDRLLRWKTTEFRT